MLFLLTPFCPFLKISVVYRTAKSLSIIGNSQPIDYRLYNQIFAFLKTTRVSTKCQRPMHNLSPKLILERCQKDAHFNPLIE